MVYKNKKTKKLNSEDNYTKTEENDTESEIHKTDFDKNTSLASDYNSPEKVPLFQVFSKKLASDLLLIYLKRDGGPFLLRLVWMISSVNQKGGTLS